MDEGIRLHQKTKCKALATHLDNMRYESAGKAIYRILELYGISGIHGYPRAGQWQGGYIKALGDQENSLFDFLQDYKKLQEMMRGLRGSEE